MMLSMIMEIRWYSNDVWQGPGIVQSIESKTIHMTHNGQLKIVAVSRARPFVDTSVIDLDDEGVLEEDIDDS